MYTLDGLIITVITLPEFQFLPLNGLFSPSFSSSNSTHPPPNVKPIAVPQTWADSPEAGMQSTSHPIFKIRLICEWKIHQPYPIIRILQRVDRLALRMILKLVGRALSHQVETNLNLMCLFPQTPPGPKACIFRPPQAPDLILLRNQLHQPPLSPLYLRMTSRHGPFMRLLVREIMDQVVFCNEWTP